MTSKFSVTFVFAVLSFGLTSAAAAQRHSDLQTNAEARDRRQLSRAGMYNYA